MNSYISHTRYLAKTSFSSHCMCTCDRTHQSTFISNPHSHGVSLYQPVAIHSNILFCYRKRFLNSRLYVAIRIAIIFLTMNDEYGYLNCQNIELSMCANSHEQNSLWFHCRCLRYNLCIGLWLQTSKNKKAVIFYYI